MENRRTSPTPPEVKSSPSDSMVDSDFEGQSQQRQPSIVVEFADFLIHNKRWWLTPIFLVLLVISIFVMLTSTAVGPFIYVLF
jgi:hypothetical protein